MGIVPENIGDAADRAMLEEVSRETLSQVLQEDLGVDPNSDLGKRVVEAELRKQEELRALMSPPGSLKIPEALERKRWAYLIPDEAFATEPLFDRILVFQIPTNEGETAGRGSKIVLTERSKDWEQKRSPRGVIISMGLLAADQLKSNGTDIGDTVHIILSHPWHRPLGRYGGHDLYLLVMRAGDLVDNEDLRGRLERGDVKRGVQKNKDGAIQHVLKDENGELWYPEMPWITEDF